MPDANETAQTLPAARRTRRGWLFPALRVLLVIVAGFLGLVYRGALEPLDRGCPL